MYIYIYIYTYMYRNRDLIGTGTGIGIEYRVVQRCRWNRNPDTDPRPFLASPII